MIQGVSIQPLKQIHDERGKVMHMMKTTDPHFEKFGEVYFSCVHEGVVKGWHIHEKMTLNYAVPHGKIKLVLYDDRKSSPTKGEVMELFLSPENYSLVTVPPLVWNGFKGVAKDLSIVANCATIPHDPSEIRRCDPFSPEIPYDWELKHG